MSGLKPGPISEAKTKAGAKALVILTVMDLRPKAKALGYQPVPIKARTGLKFFSDGMGQQH
jgi:hypothetical protein